MSLNFAQYLLYENPANLAADHTVTYFDGQPYTVGDYRQSVQELVTIFEAKGIQAGGAVPNLPQQVLIGGGFTHEVESNVFG